MLRNIKEDTVFNVVPSHEVHLKLDLKRGGKGHSVRGGISDGDLKGQMHLTQTAAVLRRAAQPHSQVMDTCRSGKETVSGARQRGKRGRKREEKEWERDRAQRRSSSDVCVCVCVCCAERPQH